MYIADPEKSRGPTYAYTLHLMRPAMLSEGPTEEEVEAGEEHWLYSQELLRKNIIVFAGRTLVPGEEAFALVVIQAETETEARAIVEDDPAVKAGVFSACLYPFQTMLVGDWPGNVGGRSVKAKKRN